MGVLAAALVLGACSVQTLYGPTTVSGGSAVQSTLTRISVGPVNDRVGQQVRNRVIFQMAGGKEISDPLYHMTLTVTYRQEGLGITVTEASPVYSVIVQATFTVKKVGTDEVLVTGTSRASASYNYVNSIVSPASTSASSSDKWVLASKAPISRMVVSDCKLVVRLVETDDLCKPAVRGQTAPSICCGPALPRRYIVQKCLPESV